MSKITQELKSPQLKTILNKTGKTPNDEPDIYNFIKDDPTMSIFEIPKFVIERAGKSMDDFDSDELALFFRLIKEKVMSTKYDSGEFKSTENTKELENISFSDQVSLFKLTQKAIDIEIDDKKGMKKIVKEQQDFIWNIVNLNKKSLSDWEVNLVEAIVMEQAIKMAQTALDVDLGN